MLQYMENQKQLKFLLSLVAKLSSFGHSPFEDRCFSSLSKTSSKLAVPQPSFHDIMHSPSHLAPLPEIAGSTVSRDAEETINLIH